MIRFLSTIVLAIIVNSPGYCYGPKSKFPEAEIGPDDNYGDLYKKGKEAYLEDNFRGCVDYFEAALRDHKTYHEAVNKCKRQCKEETKRYDPVVQGNYMDLVYNEGLIRETLCLMKCKRRSISQNRIEQVFDQDVLEGFRAKKVYDYLQYCYYQTQRNQSAANAAYTNLAYNPESDIMKTNLKYFLELPGVDKNKLRNLEAPAFVDHYVNGKNLYTAGDWKQSIKAMEMAIDLYMDEEENCRAGCEKPFNMGWFPDYVSSVANHFTFCLKCKLNCAIHLMNINGEQVEDIVSSFYDYLQYGYFQEGNYDAAMSAALSHLEFFPDSEVMNDNVNYYRAYGGEGEPRPEVIKYLAREKDELALLDFIDESFVFTDDNDSSAEEQKGQNNEESLNQSAIYNEPVQSNPSEMSHDTMKTPKAPPVVRFSW